MSGLSGADGRGRGYVGEMVGGIVGPKFKIGDLLAKFTCGAVMS